MSNGTNQIVAQCREDDDCVVASKLLETCNKVQFLGVTATLCGFIAYISNADHLKDQPYGILLRSIPIILAYLTIANPIFMPDKFKANPRALLWTCWGIFFLDTIYLGVLVAITGGANDSLFSPLFLLIPSAGACFCGPRKKPFWILISAVVITYMTGWCIELFGPGGGDPSPIGPFGLWLKSCFTVGCIATAAYCYASTYSIRHSKCQDPARRECPYRIL